jgi:hypothetical protein
MIEVGERLLFWTAPHPSWKPNSDWPREVGCVLYRHPESVVLIDPLIRDDLDTAAWSWLDSEVGRAETPVAVLLTAPWHQRSVRGVAARYGGRVWASPAARARLGDLPWLEEPLAGIRILVPRGVDEGQVAFFIAPVRTLVVAELFLGTESGLEVRPSPGTTDEDEFNAFMRELEGLPVEHVLVGHGAPVINGGGEAISAALRRFGI